MSFMELAEARYDTVLGLSLQFSCSFLFYSHEQSLRNS